MILAGLLLDSSLLDSDWFRVFSLFVAINTLMYLGLTLSKFLPWPRQMHPRQVRTLLRASAGDGDSDADSKRGGSITETPLHTGDPYVDARRSVAARSVYRALGLLGIQVVAVNLAQLVVFPTVSIPLAIISLCFGLTGIVLSIALGRHRERPEVAIWLWAMLATAFILVQCIHAIGQRVPLDIADAIIVLVLIPPIALSWPASLTSSAISAVAIMVAVVIDQGADGLATLFAILSATFGGLIVMHLRRVAIDEGTTAHLALTMHPTTDAMTGALSLEALRTLCPNLFALGARTDTPVHLVSITIEDLGSLRTDYGFVYSSVLLSSIARALAEIAEPGDLVARRSDDEFLLLGLGAIEAEEFHSRLDAQLASAPVDLGKRRTGTQVSVLFDDAAAELLSAPVSRTDARDGFLR